MDCSMPGFPVHHQLPETAQTHVHPLSDASNHLILCCPLLLLPSIFLSIRVFFNESVLHIRWPKYWSFSFSLCPSNEYWGLISFRMWTNQRVVTFKFHWLNVSQDIRMVIIISMQKHYDNVQTYFQNFLKRTENSVCYFWIVQKIHFFLYSA